MKIIKIKYLFLYGPRHEEKCLRTCAIRADSDHTAHAKSTLYHPGLCSAFKHSVVSNDSVLDQTVRHAQSDFGLCCPHMPEDTFSNGAARIMVHVTSRIISHEDETREVLQYIKYI